MPRRYDAKTFDMVHLRKTAERLKSWGKWGPDDELGTLNYVTPAEVAAQTPPALSAHTASTALSARPSAVVQ